MDVKETVESLIKQAESLNTGESSLAWDYNVDWQVKLVVKRKRSSQRSKTNKDT